MAKLMLTILLTASLMLIISIFGIIGEVKDQPELASKMVELAISTFTFLTLVLILTSFMAYCLIRWFRKGADTVDDVIENGKRKTTDATKVKPSLNSFRILLLLELFMLILFAIFILTPTIGTTTCEQQQLTEDKQNVSLKIPDNVTVEFSDADLNQEVNSVNNLTAEFIRVHSKAHLAASVSGMKKEMPDNVTTEFNQSRNNNSCVELSYVEMIKKAAVNNVTTRLFNTWFAPIICVFMFAISILMFMGLRRFICMEDELLADDKKILNCDDDDYDSDESTYSMINVEELMDTTLNGFPAEIQIGQGRDETA